VAVKALSSSGIVSGCWNSRRGINNTRILLYVCWLPMFKTVINWDYINLTKSLVEVFATHSFKNLSQVAKRIECM
jgi:hypothetical protein